ncbi:urease accessory protein UreF [Thioalkalivibrio sulfidiphilus]|uniref:urease accessory protein UreF n=1 Tax=Thioalkalivibrio sulfidiphilus TaxID=1033854 RepID=UPI003BB1862A
MAVSPDDLFSVTSVSSVAKPPFAPSAETTPDSGLARRRLWQLIAPTLPVGAYSYSTGLEYAVEAGWVNSEAAAADWIGAQLHHVHAHVDLPALLRLHGCWGAKDSAGLDRWSAWLMASRETSELRAEDTNQGRALARLLTDLDVGGAEPWVRREDAAWATLFALACAHWDVPTQEMLEGYLWAWCENQVAAAVKLIPLGQTQGQRLLLQLAEQIGPVVMRAQTLDDEDMGGGLPGVMLASALHETQYSRLFRS